MITREQFAAVMAYISAGSHKPISEPSIAVYYDLLGDLPIEALNVAAKRAILENKYATFPAVAMLREFAFDSMRGEVKSLTGAEAFGIAMSAMASCDIESYGSLARAFAGVPASVKAAVRQFGFMAMYNMPSNSIETARAQFTKIFEAIAEREKKTGILPAAVQEQIAEIGKAEPPALRAARANVLARSEIGT